MPRRPLTDEEKQRLRDNLAAARARKAEKAATAVAEAPAEAEEPSSEGVLATLAGLFQKAAGDKAGRDKAVNEALDVLGKLDPRQHPDIASNETVLAFVDQVQAARAQSSDVRPGTLIGTGMAAFIKPWTWADLNKGKDLPIEEVTRRANAGEIIFPWVTYRSPINKQVWWNGLTVVFPRNRTVYVCKVFVDVLEESFNLEEFAERHAAWLFNNPDVQPERDMFQDNGPRVKAMDMSKGEYFIPDGGMIDLTPSADLVALGGGAARGEE